MDMWWGKAAEHTTVEHKIVPRDANQMHVPLTPTTDVGSYT